MVGKLYGSIADGTAREFYQPRTTHHGVHISPEAIGDAIDWFQATLTGRQTLCRLPTKSGSGRKSAI